MSSCAFQRALLVLLVSGTASGGSTGGEIEPSCSPAPPNEVVIDVSESDSVTWLSWPAQSGFRTDLVRGNLRTLALTHGDYAASVELCFRDDVPDINPVYVADPEPPDPGEGFWYLVRIDQYLGCPTEGSGDYNESCPGLTGFRNAEIRMSGRDCACNYPCDYYP
jgi:hypothetical protein